MKKKPLPLVLAPTGLLRFSQVSKYVISIVANQDLARAMAVTVSLSQGDHSQQEQFELR